MTKTVQQIYVDLATRINYPLTPSYRCMSKVIGYINILLALVNTPQFISEVELTGEKNHKTYSGKEKIAYLYSGKPARLNPDGTINTTEDKAYVISKYLFKNSSNEYISYINNETDMIVNDDYVQPLVTALYLLFNNVSPDEAATYLNSSCSQSQSEMYSGMIDLDNIRKRL